MKAYKNKERNCPETKVKSGSLKGTVTNMCLVLDNVQYDDLAAVADYFAKQKFVRAKQKFDAELAKKGKALHDDMCDTCHAQGGTDPKDDAGITGGQWMFFLRMAFDAFGSEMRPIDKKMKARLNNLSKDDIEALINYYGSEQ
jgi:sulfide dehydrogenase cytochrome subunit